MTYEASGADRYKETAGFIYSCISVVRERNSLGARVLLTNQIDLVTSLVQKTCKWGRCDYLLHLLLAGVRAMDHESVLNQIPEEHRELFKKTLAVAVKHSKPDVKAAEAERKSSMEKARQNNWNLKSDDKQLNLCNRNAAECALLVAERWNTVIEELKDWAKLLDVPYDENVWQEQKSESKKKHKEPTPPKKPDFPVIDDEYIERVRNNKGRGRPKKDKTVVVTPANLVKVSPEEKQKTYSDTITTEDGKELWSISKLEEKLGVKNFAAKKAYYIKHHPTTRGIIERWFEKRGKTLYFKSENFSTLQTLMFPPKKEKPVKSQKAVVQGTVGLTPVTKDEKKRRSDIFETVDGKKLWSIPKLEKELKISNFSMRKSQHLKKHPGDRKKIEGWFEKRGTALYFDSAYFEKLKELMFPTKTENNNLASVPQQPVLAPQANDGVIQQTQEYQDENLLILFGVLAQTLGYTNREVLRNKIITCLGRATEEEQDKVKSWFIKKGKSPFGWFSSGHISELRTFLNSYDKRKRKKVDAGEQVPVVADDVETVIEPQPIADEPVVSAVKETVAQAPIAPKPQEVAAPVVVVEETNVPKIEETVVPAASLPQGQKILDTDIPAFGMADVRAVVSYLEHLMALIELANNDYQAAEIKYIKAKEDYERLDKRLGELKQTFGDIKDALVNVEKAETYLANVLKQYLPQQNIVH